MNHFITWITGLSNSVGNWTTINYQVLPQITLFLHLPYIFSNLKCFIPICRDILIKSNDNHKFKQAKHRCFRLQSPPTFCRHGFAKTIHPCQSVLLWPFCQPQHPLQWHLLDSQLSSSLEKTPQQHIVVRTIMAEVWTVIKREEKCSCSLNIQHQPSTLQPDFWK